MSDLISEIFDLYHESIPVLWFDKIQNLKKNFALIEYCFFVCELEALC